MKVNELMVGDWVEMNLNPSVHKYYFKAQIVVSNLVSLENNYDFDAKPIPLTEDILKANGFCPKNEDLSRKVLQGDYGNKISIVFIVQNNRIHIYRNIHKILNLKIHYVHELQHALRLCGLTYLANNFKIE